MAIQITMKCVPELDPEFVPAALWNREYGKLAAADAGRRKLALCVERANGCVSRFDTVILADTPENRALNLRYVERIVKFLLWARGGWKLTVAGSSGTGSRAGEDLLRRRRTEVRLCRDRQKNLRSSVHRRRLRV